MKLTFKKGKFNISKRGGLTNETSMFEEEGFVCQEMPFGLHKKESDLSNSFDWVLTHTHTGLMLKSFPKRKEAVEFLSKLADENIDWNFTETDLADIFFAVRTQYTDFLRKHFPERMLKPVG